MTVVKVVEDIAFGAHWPCQSIGRGLCAKVQTGGSPRASREPLVASADMPSVGPEKDRHFSQCASPARRNLASGGLPSYGSLDSFRLVRSVRFARMC